MTNDVTGHDDDTEVSIEVVDVVPDDVTEETQPSESGRTAPARSSAWIAWTVAVALAMVAAFAVVQWRAVAGPEATVADARAAAVSYVEVLSTWDASSGLEPTYAALVAGATEEFLPEVDEVFGDEQREELVAADAVSTGTIEDVLTGEPESGTVQVVVIVEQFVVTGPTADPAARTERVALLRMAEQDGQWLVDDLEMLSELELAEEAQ